MDHSPRSDADLLRRWCQERDEQAAEELTNRLQPLAERVCQDILGPGAEAADLAHESLAALLLEAAAIRGEPGAWLRRCATRRCLMWLRSQRRRRQVELAQVAEPVAAAPRRSGPVDPAGLVEAILAALRPAERDLLVRYYLLGESQAAIAGAAAVSQPAVARRLAQAVERLRRDPRLRDWLPSAA